MSVRDREDTADPNRSAAFLHPLQEDSCLAVVGKDMGANKLAMGYSLFTVVRARPMRTTRQMAVHYLPLRMGQIYISQEAIQGLEHRWLPKPIVSSKCHALNRIGNICG